MYGKITKEIFEENFDYFDCVSKITIESLAPLSASFDENENSPVYKVGGVFINASIAS